MVKNMPCVQKKKSVICILLDERMFSAYCFKSVVLYMTGGVQMC